MGCSWRFLLKQFNDFLHLCSMSLTCTSPFSSRTLAKMPLPENVSYGATNDIPVQNPMPVQQPTDAMPWGTPRQMPNGGHWILNRNVICGTISDMGHSRQSGHANTCIVSTWLYCAATKVLSTIAIHMFSQNVVPQKGCQNAIWKYIQYMNMPTSMWPCDAHRIWWIHSMLIWNY